MKISRYVLFFIKNRFHFFKYTGSIERVCVICGKQQINIREISTSGGLRNNWVDLN